MRRAFRVAAAVGCAVVASGHVGNSNVYFEGSAGPYPVRVVVRVPGVVPGLAQISVRSLDDQPLDLVTVRPLRWDAGIDGAPPADTAVSVPGEPGLFDAELWLMTAGSYSVRVGVRGARGEGTVHVPVLAVAERRLEMNLPMTLGLLGAGAFLFVGAITIFGAAVRESVLEPGRTPDQHRRQHARRAMTGGGIAMAFAVWSGWQWWDDVDAAYRQSMFRPLAVSSAVDASPERRLTISIEDEAWLNRNWTPLIPDHGKLVHMFAVRDGDLAGFAHLHPVAVDSSTFVTALPGDLPAGEYRIYADIVHESGFAQTLTDTVTVPAAPANAPPVFGNVQTLTGNQPVFDPDNSWAVTPAAGSAAETQYALASGNLVRWNRPSALLVNRELSLEFVAVDGSGAPARIGPYMGMLSHAAITRDDGSVFVHLHPSGTINMAAKMRFERAESETGVGPTPMQHGPEAPVNAVRFPFEFTRSGRYRIWVQFMIDGVVETAAFDMVVTEAPED